MPSVDLAGDAVSDGAVGEILDGHLARNRRRIGPLIVFDDEHKRRALRGREIQAFVKCAGGRAAIADPSERDDILAEIAAGHRDAGHHRNQISEHRNGRNGVMHFQIAEMAGAVFAERGRSVFGHVLGEDVARLEALYQQRADIADHRSEPVFRLERVGRAYRNRFLPEAGIKSADDFVLAEEADHAVFELAIELHVVVEVEILLARELCGAWFLIPSPSLRRAYDGLHYAYEGSIRTA